MNEIKKTYKNYVGGKYLRSESGKTFRIALKSEFYEVPLTSRKDVRDAVVAAKKGFTEWKQTVEIFSFRDNNDNNLSKLVNFFHKGLNHFYSRNWNQAIKEFSKSKEYEKFFNDEDINPSNIFIERCNKFISNPPPEKWDGHFRLEKK